MKAMRVMGFSTGCQDLVYHNICNIRYRVCVNGFYSPEFHSSKGVRQGDPFSPSLFIIAQQILSFNLNRKHEMGTQVVQVGQICIANFSLFYADEMLIFTNGRIQSLQCLTSLMIKYEEASGQKINLESAFYPSKLIWHGRLTRIQ